MSVIISGTGLFTPKESITNAELVESYNQYADIYNEENKNEINSGSLEPLVHSNADFIKKVSGLEKRYVLDKAGVLDPNRMRPNLEERSNDQLSIQAEISISACKEAMAEAGKTAANIDAVICGCANLQRAYPAVAIEIQKELGIEGYAYDMNVACSSATFALQNAVNDIESGVASCILVVNPDICSGHLNFKDRDGHFIFGDACTAILLEKDENRDLSNAFQVIGTKLKTSFSNNIRNNFGFLNIPENSDVNDPDKLFIQKGKSVFKEVVPMVVEMISSHLNENNLAVADVSRFWLHQANLSMNALIAKRLLGREPNEGEIPVVLNEYANTSSAGSIIALHKYKKDLKKDDVGVICSFGAGYSVGSVIIKKV
jgi:beta-ketodecanoyl-[acyl-carrier-protein] synthase